MFSSSMTFVTLNSSVGLILSLLPLGTERNFVPLPFTAPREMAVIVPYPCLA